MSDPGFIPIDRIDARGDIREHLTSPGSLDEDGDARAFARALCGATLCGVELQWPAGNRKCKRCEKLAAQRGRR